MELKDLKFYAVIEEITKKIEESYTGRYDRWEKAYSSTIDNKIVLVTTDKEKLKKYESYKEPEKSSYGSGDDFGFSSYTTRKCHNFKTIEVTPTKLHKLDDGRILIEYWDQSFVEYPVYSTESGYKNEP